MSTPLPKKMSPPSLGTVPARRVTLVPVASALLMSASCTLLPSTVPPTGPTSAPSTTSMSGAHRVHRPAAPAVEPASTTSPRMSNVPPLNVPMLPPVLPPRADSRP